jgi:hypothetical protein
LEDRLLNPYQNMASQTVVEGGRAALEKFFVEVKDVPPASCVGEARLEGEPAI